MGVEREAGLPPRLSGISQSAVTVKVNSEIVFASSGCSNMMHVIYLYLSVQRMERLPDVE